MKQLSLAWLLLVLGCSSTPDLDQNISDLPDASHDAAEQLPDAAASATVLTDVTDVSVGRDRLCAIAGTRVFCGEMLQPLQLVPGLSDVVDVAVGDAHACADMRGDIYCWGSNAAAMSPSGTSASPTPQIAFSTAIIVVAGANHTCVMSNDHTTPCWGSISAGFGASFMLFAAPNRVCAIASSKHVYCWQPMSKPALLPQLRDVAALAISDVHGCASNDGRVTCWGSNAFGQLGLDPTLVSASNTPREISAPQGVVSLAAGETFTCALSDGAVTCWGQGYGFVPQLIALSHRAIQIEAQHTRACAVLDDNTLACWAFGEAPALVHGAQ